MYFYKNKLPIHPNALKILLVLIIKYLKLQNFQIDYSINPQITIIQTYHAILDFIVTIIVKNFTIPDAILNQPHRPYHIFILVTDPLVFHKRLLPY
jgi:hypothetical protein